ncbi:MAG: phage holin family protein [Burkholderia sp.]
MPTKDPTNWGYATWLLAIGMSCAGGLVNWYARVKQGHTRAFNIIELIGEIFTSAFVGLGVFMAVQALDQPIGLCAALAGVGGHMATRLLFAVEKWIEARFRTLAKGKA